MGISKEMTVGQLVAEKPALARVLEKYRIDYCCGGKIPLAQACAVRGADAAAVWAELEECDREMPIIVGADWTRAPLGDLAEHIVSSHHEYLRSELPRLEGMAARVAKVHGDRAPEVLEIHGVFRSLRAELEEHMMKEERILFPWIRSLEAGALEKVPFATSVGSPIRCMEAEHESAGCALESLRTLSSGYTPPMDACNTWRVLYASLAALEEDMHTHVHKENSILFPRALALEARFHTTA